MARTKGAKDKQIRKKPALRTRPIPATPARESAVDSAPADRPAIPPDEFHSAIERELQRAGTAELPGTSPASTGPAQTATDAPGTPPFEPSALTLDGLASAWQCAFYALGQVLLWLHVTPDAEPIYAVGRRRAKDLAKPSYTVYEHYTRTYLGMNPDNEIHVAAAVTVLNGVGIIPDLVDAVVTARRKEAAKRASPPPASHAGVGTTPV